MGLTVAVTGPTGQIGISTVGRLEREPAVKRIIGMARRPFDPSAHGWTKTVYQQGDIRDRAAVDALVADADVVVHLAFQIMGSRHETESINLGGTRNVFEATVGVARRRRLVYTSSVAAYGYHPDHPSPITEDVPTRGTPEHYYSQQKAACEADLAALIAGSDSEVYVLRPCIVAGPKAPALAAALPWNHGPGMLRTVVRALLVVPDPGIPMQLVHHDDVAKAIALAVTTSAPPGPYNIAADGLVSISEVVQAFGGHAVRVPHVAATAASALLAHFPFVPAVAEWLHTIRAASIMDTTRARMFLGWTPAFTTWQALDALARTKNGLRQP
jgi:UDP-glucose 4-epimerase